MHHPRWRQQHQGSDFSAVFVAAAVSEDTVWGESWGEEVEAVDVDVVVVSATTELVPLLSFAESLLVELPGFVPGALGASELEAPAVDWAAVSGMVDEVGVEVDWL